MDKMNYRIRKWKLSDAKDLAIALSNKKIQDNLRDGLPYPFNSHFLMLQIIFFLNLLTVLN